MKCDCGCHTVNRGSSSCTACDCAVCCRYCSQITEEAVREAMTTHVPLKIERIEETSRWLRVDETHFKLTWFCDACGQDGAIVVEMIDEPDPADWWKA